MHHQHLTHGNSFPGDQNKDGSRRNVTRDDLNRHHGDAADDDDDDEDDSERRFADRLLDEGDVTQAYDPDDAETADADASRRKRRRVNGAERNGWRRVDVEKSDSWVEPILSMYYCLLVKVYPN